MGEEKKAGKDGGGGDKKKDAGAGAAPQPIVLKVDLHCAGCASKVRKAIKRAPGASALRIAGGYIRSTLAVGGGCFLFLTVRSIALWPRLRAGVESVTPDMAAGKVVVTGPADAVELKERIEARAKKPVQIVSAGAGPPKKDKEKEKEKKADGGEKKADNEKGGGDGEKKADKEKGGGENKADKEKGGGGGGKKKADKEKGADKPKEEKKPKEVSYLPIIIRVRWGGDPRHRLPPCPWSATERLSLPFSRRR